MSLEIINQQGAQVVALQQAIEERNALIRVLVASGTKRRWTKAEIDKAQDTAADSITWKILRDGTLIFTVK